MKATSLVVRVAGGIAASLLLSGAALGDSTARADRSVRGERTVLAGGTVSPSSVPVGQTVTLTATNCDPASGTAVFRINGPGRDQAAEQVRTVRSTTAAPGGPSAELRTADFAPGAYTVTAVCGDGAPAGTATLTITATGGDRVDGRASDDVMTVAGAAVLLANALGGLVILARRRRHAITAARL
ncbi:hypothetical protein QQG74_17065 [Micromonospora sp. FIMYZ51]|uniref:hypothetical protein n=1 Tax=Micromonospora sp. FIMYZ51 TaxID=3051832 RepID=UPI00311FB363